MNKHRIEIKQLILISIFSFLLLLSTFQLNSVDKSVKDQNNYEKDIENLHSGNTYENQDHTIIVFDHEYSNTENPAIKTIKVLGEPVSCRMELIAYCDPDDPYLRAVYFALDDIGDPIGVERIAPGQVRGDVTIRQDETKTWEFEMSNCQFAKPSPETGSYFRNFIPQSEENKLGFLGPGEHTITAYITSQDAFKGDTQDSWITIKLHFVFKEIVVTVLDHEYSNADHPAQATINIPTFPMYCRMQITAYCDPDDPYLRAVYFALDDIGDPIGVERIGPGQVRGDVTIRRDETKTWEFDMSNCQFAKPSPETGSYYRNFITQSENDIVGFLSPGEHTITAFVTSQDAFKDPIPMLAQVEGQDSWITIKLFFIYDEFILNVFDHEYSNADHPAQTNINIPCLSMYCRMQITAYCDPDDPYLRAVYFALDDIGDPIGVERIGPGQVRGDVTIQGGETKTWEFDMSNCQFAKPSPEIGAYYRNFIPQSENDIIGFLSPGEHTITAFVTSQDAFKDPIPMLAQVEGQDSWISIKLYFVFIEDPTPPIINIDYVDGDQTDENPGKWKISAEEDVCCIDENSINVRIDGLLVGHLLGVYNVPQILGFHSIFVELKNTHPRKPLSNSESHSINIFDDDTIAPVVNVEYTGDGTDGNPGTLIVTASDASGLSEDPSGIYPVPNNLGSHVFTFTATDNDNDRFGDSLTTTITRTIHIVDDDTYSPHITLRYFGGASDGLPGYFKWDISDYDNNIGGDHDTGFSDIEIIVEYKSSEGRPDLLIKVFPSEHGTWYLLPYLGRYTISVTATDNDNDRTLILDSLTAKFYNRIILIDDDKTPPTISIVYTGDGTDGNPGTLIVTASDASGLSEDPSGIYPIPNNLGSHVFTFTATDNDDDRSGDSLTTTITETITLIDDDILSPIISNVFVEDNFCDIFLRFNALDDSNGDDKGIGKMYIYIDNELVQDYFPSPDETFFEFIIQNDWILQMGVHELLIEVWDADNDRDSDSLSMSFSTTFETTIEDFKQFINWEMEQLINKIESSKCDCWRNPCCNRKKTMVNKLLELQDLFKSNKFDCAFEKLLHDIKPKLTGLKTDQNEEPWANGVFKNPWVICNQLKEEFRIACNNILSHIRIFIC